MNTSQGPSTLFGDVGVSPIGPQDRRIGYSPIEYRLSYINNMPVPVTVEWRSGIKFTLPPQPSFDSNCLVVRVEITIHPSVKVDIQRVLSAVTDDDNSELRALRQAFRLSVKNPSYGSSVLILDYPLTLEQLRQYGGSVYYHELDAVFSLMNFHQTPPHPFGIAGRNMHLIDAADKLGSKIGFNYAVEVVDNAGKHGDRYLNIGNKVYRAPAQRDPERRDGIYIISNEPVEGQVELAEREIKYYPFEGAEEAIGLFETPEEALNLGDLSLAKRQEILNLEHQITIGKAELVMTKQTHEKEMADKDRELKLLEMERERQARVIEELRSEAEHRMKLERERVKDYYEDKSYERKNENEVLKFIPGVIVGLGAIFLAFRNLMGSGVPKLIR